MTNFERMKPGLDILFDDITAEELADLFVKIDCEYCKLRDKCSADDEWPLEDAQHVLT